MCSDFGAPKNKDWHCFHCLAIYFPWSDGTRCHDLHWVPGLHLGKQSQDQYICTWVADSGQRKKSMKCCINCCCSVAQLCLTPWTAAHQASLSFTIFQSFLRLTSIELMMPSNHLILCSRLLLLPEIFPSIRVLTNESALCIRWPSIGASASVLPMNVQGWFPD